MSPIVPILASAQLNLEWRDYCLIALAVFFVFTILISVGGLIVGVLALRRTPPIEREIDDRIAKKTEEIEKRIELDIEKLREEVIRLNQERRVTMANLFQKLEDTRRESKDDYAALQKSVGKSFEDLNFTIGRLEGQLANKTAS